MTLSPGTRLGAYEIVSAIGAGGMGEIYRAKDLRLDRVVALKVLPTEVSNDPERLRRFHHEARAASSLNHPHIVSIHDTGESDSIRYIVMELVDGHPLDVWIAQRQPDLRTIIQVVTQIADAVSAAHQAGIIHRDIKPANVIVTAQGYAKVLDFGLAKLIEPVTPSEATRTADISRAGAIVGTVGYMSPEQVLAKSVDARTDVFSLGVVLYEAVSGNRPFVGDTDVDRMHAIVRAIPRSLREAIPDVPAELEWILDKALAKDADDRHQTMRELSADLRRLQRRLEAPPSMQEKPKPPSRIAVKMVAAAALAAMVTAVVLWGVTNRATDRSVGVAYDTFVVSPLTTAPGYEGEPTFSRDGQTIAYVSDRTGNFDIYLKQISGGPEVNLTNHPADDVQPSFSPDGRQIAFVSSRGGTSDVIYQAPNVPLLGGDIWVMPALGGNARRIVERGNFPSWSPDGAAIIYTAGAWFDKRIYRVSAIGGEPREIPVRFTSPQPPAHLSYPRYSPDGRWIAFAVPGGHVYVVNSDGGEPLAIARGGTPIWSPDSDAIIYSNAERTFSLWRIPFDGDRGTVSGPPKPLTIDRGQDLHPAISHDGSLIAFTALEVSANIERVPFDPESGRQLGAAELLTKGKDAIYFFSPSPDGRSVVFERQHLTGDRTWRADIDGSPVQLTADSRFFEGGPRWSPDGRTIAFARTPAMQPGAAPGIWLMQPDGANPRALHETAGLTGLSTWTPDSKRLLFISAADRQLHSIDVSTRDTQRLTSEPGLMPISTVSRDGRWVAYQSVQTGSVDLRAIPIEGGASMSVVATPMQDYHPLFSPSGRWLYFQLDHKNLYRVPGPAQAWQRVPPQKVTDFQFPSGVFVEDSQLSADGRYLLYARGRMMGDIWLLSLKGESSSRR